MKVFDLFVSKYPPGNDLRKPTAETLEQFQGKVPAELLNFWQEYGFGNYGGGLLKIIDPTDYIDTLTLWLGEQEGCLPILMTGFGTLFIYRKLSDTADDMCLLDIHNRRSGSFSTSFSDFFERIIPAENFAAQFLRVGLFQEAFAKHGGLSENEIFFFAPALPKVTPILHEISFSSFLSIRIFSMARRIFSSFLSNFSGFVLSI